MPCPKCKHEINTDHFPLGIIFCPYCGERIREQEPFQIIPFCGHCGHRFLTEVAFCPECGKRVATEKAAMPPEAEKRLEPVTINESPEAHPPEPEDVETPEQPKQSISPGVKAAWARITQPVENILSGRWRLKRLYREWSTHDSLPAEEIPTDKSLKDIAVTVPQPAYKPVSLWVAIALGAGLLILFEAVGMFIKRQI